MRLSQLLAEAGGDRAEAARRAGIGRSTMYRWLKQGLQEEPLAVIQARYRPRPRIVPKLAAYTALITARLTEYPDLSATRLFAECCAAGYTGGISQLRAFVAGLRPPAPEPVRFETVPGHQAQVDFAHCRLPWGVRYALVVVLGHARLLWIQFYPRQDLRALEHGLAACFAAWGGVPRELLFDQMRSVLTRDDRLTGGGLVANLELARFVRHYGARVKVCRPYRAQTKGKVERPIRYVRESFLYGRAFVSDADLNAQVLTWLETVANVRVHGTTGWVPAERFATVEQPTLQPLPTSPYRTGMLPLPARGASGGATAGITRALPEVVVERRSLQDYAALSALGAVGAGGAS